MFHTLYQYCQSHDTHQPHENVNEQVSRTLRKKATLGYLAHQYVMTYIYSEDLEQFEVAIYD